MYYPFYFKKGELYMRELLFFMIGTLIGGIIATMFMCCIQINRLNKYEEYKPSEDSSDEE